MVEVSDGPDLHEALSKVNSVAIVGATPKEGKIGNLLLKNVTSSGFKGRVYPVNPNYQEILGLKTYPSLLALPEVPDVVVVAVPVKAVPQVLEDAIKKGCKVAVIITSGFKEAGNVEAQKALEKVISSHKIRVIGPNSAGISLMGNKLHASIEVLPEAGSVGLAMQSGAMGGVVISRLKELSSGISFFMSIGNAADVGVEEIFEYASRDEGTQALIAYIEWVRDGRKFLRAGKFLSLHKPLCILKGGRGEKSLKAVASHTGGLAGSYAIFKAAVRKVGAYLADDVDDLVEVCEVLRRLNPIRKGRVLIVSNSGGLAIVTASQLEEQGIELPELHDLLKNKIVDKAEKKFSGSNPIDFGGDAFMHQVVKAFTLSELKEFYDLGILVYVPTAAEGPSDITKAIYQASKEFSIPIIAYFDGEGAREAAKEVSKVVPVVTSSKNVGKAVRALVERYAFITNALNAGK